MASRGSYRVYDPRQKGDLQLEISTDAPRFSSAAAGLIVISAEGVQWSPLADALDRAFVAAAHILFVLYRPWWPGLKAKEEAFVQEFPTAQQWDGVWFAGADWIDVRRVFSLRDRLGRDAAGVWLLGTCDDLSRLADALKRANFHTDPLLFIAAACASAIACALVLDEGGSSAVFVRLADDTVGPIESLVAAVAASASPRDE